MAISGGIKKKKMGSKLNRENGCRLQQEAKEKAKKKIRKKNKKKAAVAAAAKEGKGRQRKAAGRQQERQQKGSGSRGWTRKERRGDSILSVLSSQTHVYLLV